MGRERGSIAEITLGLELGVDPDLVELGTRYDVPIPIEALFVEDEQSSDDAAIRALLGGNRVSAQE
jgi:hypothetical protein